MANQVYFPQYKQLFEADGEGFVIISHPITQKAYKIKVSEILALADTFYTANGALNTNRVVDLAGFTLTFEDGSELFTTVDTETTFTTISGDDEAYITIVPTSITLSCAGPLGAGLIEISQTAASISIDSGTDIVSLGLAPTVSSLSTTDGADVSNFEQGANYMLLTVNPTGANSTEISLDGNHINIATTGTADLQINGSTGTAGNTLRTNGAGSAPTWGIGILSSGKATLVNGTVAVGNTAVTAGCKILVSPTLVNTSVACGILHVTARTNGVGFTVTSITPGAAGITATDQSEFEYIIVQ